ncbi:hypothetical protein BGI36_03455 [Snodgrassella communis]|uniref:transcriptional regulator n=1 Tax=Snodgrassella communis TaxID=2946699 RepID=UPI000C1E2576|nr:YdaS family helix-turn-helix protein [Snodgrassella communis]PIT22387.1 hypothetical protein BGI36_03455 [Snodgrassella communis]
MDLKTYLESKPRGEAKRLADAIKDHPSNISLWKSGKKPVPPYKCSLMQLVTNGAVTRKDLRPFDYQKHWPELEDAHDDN